MYKRQDSQLAIGILESSKADDKELFGNTSIILQSIIQFNTLTGQTLVSSSFEQLEEKTSFLQFLLVAQSA